MLPPARSSKPVLESVIEEHLRDRVESLGGIERKLRWVGRRGAPDRLVLLFGEAIFFELKRPKGTPDPHQDREIKRLRDAGMRVEVADTREAVDRILLELCMRKKAPIPEWFYHTGKFKDITT